MNKYKIPIILLLCINIFICIAILLVITTEYSFPSDAVISKEPQTIENTIAPTQPVPDTNADNLHRATLKEFLTTALKPVGKTMYVYGGGWNKEDTGAGEYAVTIGMPEIWEDFFTKQDSSYDYTAYNYEIEKGLDCSGYIGWVLYNTLETENNKDGYVFFAQEFVDRLTALNFGTKINNNMIDKYLPGDIAGSKSDHHVWISLGQCSDGSVVLVNSSPPGVRICGTVAPDGTQDSEAIRVATKAMKNYFPKWYKKFPDCAKNASYLVNYDIMRWYMNDESIMSDPDGLLSMSPEQILSTILEF